MWCCRLYIHDGSGEGGEEEGATPTNFQSPRKRRKRSETVLYGEMGRESVKGREYGKGTTEEGNIVKGEGN